MSAPAKLSLKSAIFININIMLGSGIFINSTVLAKKAGFLGAFCYVLVGILMFPLIRSIMKLISLHPSGGFYTFGSKEIHPFIGFLSAWSYIIGKLASAVIITQIAILLMQQVVPALNAINPLLLNGILMSCFILLNMLDIKIGSTIQTGFLGLKTIPIFFGILLGLYLFSGSFIAPQATNILDIPIALPLVLFAIAGFEAACSLSSRIENAAINAPRAIMISYSAVIIITTLFQFMIYGALGTNLAAMPDYRSLFPTLVALALPAGSIIQTYLINLLHCAIAASALGGSYGIIFSNNWNIYTLAQHRHLLGSSYLTKMNRFNIPWLCILIEGVIYLLFLIISQGNQIPLQQTGALGPTIAYTLSALSLWFATRHQPELASSKLTALFAIGSCLLLFASAMYGLMIYGPTSLLTFGVLLLFGSGMYVITSQKSYF
jgi:APA family basic amino acid/polyamine antiporter